MKPDKEEQKFEQALMRIHEVSQYTTIANSTINLWVAQGKFPKPYKLTPGGRAAGWQETVIDDWITKCLGDQS